MPDMRLLKTTESLDPPATGRLEVAESVASLMPLVPTYQAAFAGHPWYERSLCPASADVSDRCRNGRSPLAPNTDACEKCALVPTEPAYSAAYLESRWQELLETKVLLLYVEESPMDGIVLAAYAYRTTPAEVFARSYAGNADPRMRDWLIATFPERVVWLEEIFADLERRPKRNLWNVRWMTAAFCDTADCPDFAFRTVNDNLRRKYQSEFPGTRVFRGCDDPPPDWRDVLIMRVGDRS
jgi:hypothetical protein